PHSSAVNDQLLGGHVAQPFAFFAKAGAVPLQSKTSLASRPKQNFNRSYTYNSLNHIQSMSAPGDGCSGLSWTIDAWGNRTAQTTTGGACFSPQVSAGGPGLQRV